MRTKVSIQHCPGRKLPWMVRWWGPPDPATGKQGRLGKGFQYQRRALKFQTAKQKEIDDGGFDQPARKDVTLAALCKEYRRSRLAGLGYKSQVLTGAVIDQLEDYFGSDRQIRGIEQRHAEAFMATRQRRDGREGGLSRSTLRQVLTYAKAIFGAAVDWAYIDRNPFQPPAGRRRRSSPLLVRAKPRDWQHITPGQFEKFLTEVGDVRRRAMFWLMYGCGLRPGEAYNLTADKVDLTARLVHVENREPTDKLPGFQIKCHTLTDGDKERSVPIPAAAMADLTEAVRLSFKSGGLVVVSPERYAYIRREWPKARAGQPWGPTGRTRPWESQDMLNNVLHIAQRAMRRADIDLTAAFRLTTFRKSFGQNHANAGTPPKTLATLMGHADTQITMQFYNRVTDSNLREAARVADRLFSDPTPEEARHAG